MQAHQTLDHWCNERGGTKDTRYKRCPLHYTDRYLPSIVTTFGIVASVIEQTAEVHKDGSRGVWGYKVSLHFLGRRKWWDGDGSILQADMVLLSKGLNQCSTLKQGKDSPSDCFLFLKNESSCYRKIKISKQPVTEGVNWKSIKWLFLLHGKLTVNMIITYQHDIYGNYNLGHVSSTRDKQHA
jgi:hypothetical protein